MANEKLALPKEQAKRTNYFTSQFLVEEDFKDEQRYHLEMRRLHNRALHIWGVVEGLSVKREGPLEVSVSAGMAIDSDGSEIVIPQSPTQPPPKVKLDKSPSGSRAMFVVIAYKDDDQNPNHVYGITGQTDRKYTRVVESWVLKVVESAPDDGKVIKLARLTLNEVGLVGDPDNTVRRPAGSSVPRGGWLGAKDLYINADGNVGIGTTRPSAPLAVSAEGASLGALKLLNRRDRAGDRWWLGFGHGDNSADQNDRARIGVDIKGDGAGRLFFTTGGMGGQQERVRIDESGNVGIGTTDPGTSKLKISNSASDFVDVRFSVAGSGHLEIVGWNAGWNINAMTSGKNLYLNRDVGENSNVLVGRRDKELIVRGSDGNVGIGTPGGPAAKLHVGSGTLQIGTAGSAAGDFVTSIDSIITHKYQSETEPRYTINRDLLGSGKAGIGFGTASQSIKAGGSAVGTPASRTLAFYTSDGSDLAERVRISSSGNVGIGTDKPETRLHVVGGGDTEVSLESKENERRWTLQASGGAKTAAAPAGYFQIIDRTAGRSRLTISSSGYVGIGTTKPDAPLHVIGGKANSFDLAKYLDKHNVGGPVGQKSDLSHSIIAEERIRAAAFDTVSDARIKNVLGTSGGASDLDALLKIIITDYTYKDVIGKGNAPHKKVIAQQVEEVFPQAVSKHTDVVPDIYRQASIRDGWVALATDLKRGERVKLITEQGEGVHEVLEVTEGKFRVAFKHEGEKVFVFGREVNDFLTVDYDAIAMLNVSATQQLKKELDEEVKALRRENAELKARLDAVESAMKRLPLSVGTRAARARSSAALR